jgi:hypothetical protein
MISGGVLWTNHISAGAKSTVTICARLGFLQTDQASAPPSLSVAALKYNQHVDSIHSVQLSIAWKPVYQI